MNDMYLNLLAYTFLLLHLITLRKYRVSLRIIIFLDLATNIQ